MGGIELAKKVLFIGGETTYHLFDDIAKRTESEIVPFYGVTKTEGEIINAALSDTYAMIILNVPEIINAQNQISEIIETIQKSVKTNFVVMAEGYTSKSSLIVEAAQNGVSYFMLSDIGADRNRVFVDTLAGVKNVYDIMQTDEENQTNVVEKQKQKTRNARKKYKSISVGIAGAINRIGCTSVAIQLIKFLFSQGKSACLVDVSDTDYVKKCDEYYGTESIDYEHNRITIDGVDMYFDISADIISFVEIQGYDFIIYDMGNITDLPQKQTEFLQKKYRLLVTGSKPNEYEAFYSLLHSLYRTTISYLYNFTPEADRESILADGTSLDSKCYFVPLMDEVFSLVPESVPLFHEIFADVLPPLPESDEPPKKHGLFGKFKRRGREKDGAQ